MARSTGALTASLTINGAKSYAATTLLVEALEQPVVSRSTDGWNMVRWCEPAGDNVSQFGVKRGFLQSGKTPGCTTQRSMIQAREAAERRSRETLRFSGLRPLAHFSKNFLELFSGSQRRQYEGHCIEPEETWKSPTSSRPTPTLNSCDSR